MMFTWISPRTFLMGNSYCEFGRRDDGTQHHVTLIRGYWLGIHQVTQT